MASIQKIGERKWKATVSMGRGADGKQIRKTFTCDSEKECRKWSVATEQEYLDGRYLNTEDMRFKSWCYDWLELKKHDLSPSTYASYKMYVEKHFIPYFKNLKVSQINEIMIRKYKAAKLEELSPTTVRKHLYILSSILEDILKHKNPCKYVEPPSPAKYEYHVVTDEDFKKIWDFFKRKSYEVIILLAALCGMRRGEIYALTWNDINFDKGEIRVHKAVTMNENKDYVEKGPKSKNGYRDIVAPPEIFELLKKRRSKVKVFNANDYIFKSRPDTLTGWFARCMEKIGLPDVRFHDLRHYHATWLYRQGVPDLFAAQRLGDDINTIKRIYQHIAEDTKNQLNAEILDKFKSVK